MVEADCCDARIFLHLRLVFRLDGDQTMKRSKFSAKPIVAGMRVSVDSLVEPGTGSA